MSLCDAKPAKNQEFTHVCNRTNERGSIIVWILIMVALLGALYYTFSSGFRSGEANLSKERANLYATEILDYAQSIKQAVQTLQINGCSDTEISFENNVGSIDFTNPNSPADESCHIFKPNGAALTFIDPQEEWLDSSFEGSSPSYSTWTFATSPQIEGVGTNEADLRISINFLKEDICLKLNNKLSILNPSGSPPADSNDIAGGGTFTGTYVAPVADNIGDDGGHDLAGKTAYCRYRDAGVNSHHQFIQVLIAR